MAKCSVRECTGEPDSVYTYGEGTWRHEWLVCAFDLRRLELGALWSESDDSNEIVISDQNAPLDVLGYSVKRSTGSPVITLELGRDDITEMNVDFRISPESLQQICYVAASGDHPNAFSSTTD